MKYHVLNFVFLFLSFCCFSQTTDTLTNKTDKQGKKQGVWIKKDTGGHLVYKGQFNDNYEIGEFIYYYPTGKVKNILQYSNKGTNAYVKIYSEDEILLSEGFYRNKKKDSLWLIYAENGNKIAEERYKNGSKDGEWIIYDGNKIIESATWKNNQRNGKYYKQLSTGDYFTATYKENMLEGNFKEYYRTKQLASQGAFFQGEKNSIWEYYTENGELFKIENWNKGALVYTKIRITTQENNFMLRTDSIAYFYEKNKGIEIVTHSGY